MFAIIKMLLGTGIAALGKEINQWHEATLRAENESERVTAQVKMNTAQMQRDVLVSESKHAWNVLFRAFLALPFGLFVWKVIVWDKLLGLGVTDDLSSNMKDMMAVVYGFYFVYEIASLFKRDA